MNLPLKVQVYKPFSKKRFKEVEHHEVLKYYPAKNEEIDVLNWCRYPNYDFIFGVPTKKNKYQKYEKAFFQYRDVRRKKVNEGFYLDKVELEDFVKGFGSIKRYWRKK